MQAIQPYCTQIHQVPSEIGVTEPREVGNSICAHKAPTWVPLGKTGQGTGSSRCIPTSPTKAYLPFSLSDPRFLSAQGFL